MGKNNFLYMRLYKDIKGKVENNDYTAGTRIPSDEELMEKYNVSMITVKKALGLLKSEGVVRRVPGVGTFVNPQKHIGETSQAFEHRGEKRIGLVMEHVSSSFGLDLMYQIDTMAEERGYKVVTRFSFFNREKETKEIDFLLELGIEGLIIMPCHGVYYNTRVLKLILEGFPVVVVDKKLEGISVPSVCSDNKQAIKTLVKVLCDNNCSNIGFLSAVMEGTTSLQERRIGFYEAAEEFSIRHVSECALIFDSNIYQHPPLKENVDRVTKYFWEHPELDGVVCAEYSLLSTITEAMKQGMFSQKRLMLCCVDGSQELEITYMKQDEMTMADNIIEVLFQQIEGNSIENDILVPAVLVNEKSGNY